MLDWVKRNQLYMNRSITLGELQQLEREEKEKNKKNG